MNYSRKKITFYILLLLSMILILFGLDDFNGFSRTDGAFFSYVALGIILITDTINHITYLFYLPMLMFVKSFVIGVFTSEVSNYGQITLNMSYARIFSTFFIVLWTLFGALIAFFVINFNAIKNNHRELKIYIKRFLKFFLLVFVILNLGIFLNLNLFNTSSAYIAKACRNEGSECHANYLLAKYSNCSKDFILFTYPFKIESKVDKCTLEKFIDNNILEDISYVQFRKLNSAFSTALLGATEKQKFDYCESFLDSKTKNICVKTNPVEISKKMISFSRCSELFIKNDLFLNETEVDELKLCYKKFVNFDVYYLDYNEINSPLRGVTKVSDGFYEMERYGRYDERTKSSSPIIEPLSEKEKKEIYYKSEIELKSIKIGDKKRPRRRINIIQSSASGPLMAEFNEVRDNLLSGGPLSIPSFMHIEFVGSELKKIGNQDVLFENFIYMKGDREITNAHFIIDNTYIKIDMGELEFIDNEERNRILNFLVERYIAKKQIIDFD